jgi:hypothetical protein
LMENIMRSSETTSIDALLVILVLLGFSIAGCNGPTPVIGDPKVVEPPTPVVPGAEVSVSIDVTSPQPVAYQWKTIDKDCGRIIRGETSSAAIWQAPQQSGLCNIFVEVKIDNTITEKSIAIRVETILATPTDTLQPPSTSTNTPTFTPSNTLTATSTKPPTPIPTDTPTLASLEIETPASTLTESPPTIISTPIPILSPDLALETTIRSAQANPDIAFAAVALQAAAGRTPNFVDDFSNPSSGFEKIEAGADFTRYEDGVYLMATHPDNPCCIGPGPRGDYTAVVAQLDMRIDAFESNTPDWG